MSTDKDNQFAIVGCNRPSTTSNWIHIPLDTDPISSRWHFTVLHHFIQRTLCVLVDQSCLTLCHPMDYSPSGSSVHGILQARILEWVAISFSTVSSWCRDGTQVFWIAGRFFTIWVTREAQRTFSICGCFYPLGVDSVLIFNVLSFLKNFKDYNLVWKITLVIFG